MVNEYIRPVFLLNEPEPLFVAKPLYSSICHNNILLSKKFQRRKLEGATLTNGLLLQEETVPKSHGGLN